MSRNRLVGEQSPYLRQHADNPVDWYPWGDEAFEAARALDRPIFLSIGYATCHWCHVMAHESFEDEEVARRLNDAFVSVKVDREERPDVDSVYMTVCQMLTGHGGWPLTVVLTPDLEPFFAGTYFPRESRGGRIGMLDLVPRLRQLWTERRGEVAESADSITRALRSATAVPPGDAPGKAEISAALRTLEARYDPERGGFGGAPKFPSPHNLTFLLRAWETSGQGRYLEMVTTTLSAMRRGGIHDQLAGGFHRYATDAEWRLPHFEKMLYDQALLSLAYLEAHQATADPQHAEVARRTLDYVIRELSDDAGGFHSAEDADSEGEEGKYYVWSIGELEEALGDPTDVALARDAFGAEEDGNFRDEASGRRTGANVLLAARSASSLAGAHGLEAEAAAQRLEDIREHLLAARRERIPPGRDDKILADWNGLAIAALARAARVLGEPRYAAAAAGAADFVDEALRVAGTGLMHRWRAGEAAVRALLDDYAFQAWGSVELYEATFAPRWLRRAVSLLEEVLERFEADDGGFYQTSHGSDETLVRIRESADGALPSGNSIAVVTLLRVAHLTGRADLADAAHRALEAFGGRIGSAPAAHTAFLQAVQFAEHPTAELVAVGPGEDATTRAFLEPVRRGFHPRTVALLKDTEGSTGGDDLEAVAPFTGPLDLVDGKPAAYLCRDHACDRPRTDPAELVEALSEV